MTSRCQKILACARETRGFMPDEEGLALTALAATIAGGPSCADALTLASAIVEIGAYCGRSTLYLAAGVAAASPGRPEGGGAVIFSVDHHHGSEENQAGWEHHDPELTNPSTGRMDTLSHWRAAIVGAGVEDLVVGVVGESTLVARHWSARLALLFIDGGHGEEVAWADYRAWSPRVAVGGHLAIHDVFPDPADGGRPPYELYSAALESGEFAEQVDLAVGSLRVLRRTR